MKRAMKVAGRVVGLGVLAWVAVGIVTDPPGFSAVIAPLIGIVVGTLVEWMFARRQRRVEDQWHKTTGSGWRVPARRPHADDGT